MQYVILNITGWWLHPHSRYVCGKKEHQRFDWFPKQWKTVSLILGCNRLLRTGTFFMWAQIYMRKFWVKILLRRLSRLQFSLLSPACFFSGLSLVNSLAALLHSQWVCVLPVGVHNLLILSYLVGTVVNKLKNLPQCMWYLHQNMVFKWSLNVPALKNMCK